jgi:TPR repeat protein
MDFPSGMYFFAEMLRQGQGIKADRVEAMKWYLVAAEHPDADDAIKSLAARSVTQHRLELSFWDFRRARMLAKAWTEQPNPYR